MKQLYRVKIATGLEYECIGDEALNVAVDNHVVIRCERYMDYATVVEKVGQPIADEEEFARQRAQRNKGRHIEGQKIPQILRVATEVDDEQAAENDRQSHRAHLQTMERIKAHALEMKLIHTHYAFDRKLIIFQFSADGRIDFRELLRDLMGLFKVRVELRQVGVRDEASILGGIGTCGRPFCCATFLPSFTSINVKMAKQQGLSLNPQNISGCCGRLKCCLQYEAEIYREMCAEQKRRTAAGTGNTNPIPAGTGENAPVEEPMFDDEGTIVAAHRISVPAASGSEASQITGRRPTRGQQESRRDRNGASHSGKTGPAAPQNGGRTQRNPQKHPLPPAGNEMHAAKNEETGSGNRTGRSNDRRRDRHPNDRRRDNGERTAEQNRNSQGTRAEKPGKIGEFGC